MLKRITSVDRNFARKKWTDFTKTDKLELAYLFLFVIIFAAMTVVSILVLQQSIIVVCAMMVLVTILAVLLSQLPLWAHAISFFVMVGVGFLASCIVFMVLAGVVYLSACGMLYIWKKDDENELPSDAAVGLTDADFRDFQ